MCSSRPGWAQGCTDFRGERARSWAKPSNQSFQQGSPGQIRFESRVTNIWYR